jgi:hypothetical protein
VLTSCLQSSRSWSGTGRRRRIRRRLLPAPPVRGQRQEQSGQPGRFVPQSQGPRIQRQFQRLQHQVNTRSLPATLPLVVVTPSLRPFATNKTRRCTDGPSGVGHLSPTLPLFPGEKQVGGCVKWMMCSCEYWIGCEGSVRFRQDPSAYRLKRNVLCKCHQAEQLAAFRINQRIRPEEKKSDGKSMGTSGATPALRDG